MYTSFIGLKFLKYYNERASTKLTAREFFDQQLYPIFFETGIHLMHVSNSPFFQSIPEKELKATGKKESEVQLERLHTKVAQNKRDASVLVGNASEDLLASTSGQVTNLPISFHAEDVYASWIGEALSVGVEGGINLLFDVEEILWRVHLGWSQYRKFISATPKLKGRQIPYWNGTWLAHSLKESREDVRPIVESPKDGKGGDAVLKGINWVELVFWLAKAHPSSSLTGYAYSMGQTNTTFGFIQFTLPDVNKLWQFEQVLFGTPSADMRSKIIGLYKAEMSLRRAYLSCGSIGLRAIEPKDLKTFVATDKSHKNEEGKYIINIYKLWIMAMLNKTELLEFAARTATSLLAQEEKGGKRGKTGNASMSDKLLEAKSPRTFVEGLTDIMKSQKEEREFFREVVQEVLTMPSDNFPLFVTLIRFEYNYQKSAESAEKE
jgi:hypothetical protein